MSFLLPWQKTKKAATEPQRPNLNLLLETMRESVIIIGEDTRIRVSNAAAEKAFARAGGTLRNKRLSEVVRDLDLHKAFRRALDEKASSEIKIEVLGLERRIYNVLTAPFELDGDKGAIGFFYDVTKVEHLEKVRQEFLSNISHELRTPLTSIMTFVETLEDGAINDPENSTRFLGVIRKNAERMRRLIDDISELSLIESGRVRIEKSRSNLFSLVEEIFVNLSPQARARRIALINEVPENAVVFADTVRLEQMLTNLIDNAIKFNRESGKVTVLHRQSAKRDLISVSDTGEGISNEHLQRVFERFYRTDRARTRDIGGTGLGLAIVKHLARLQGGEVSAESMLGKGTTFIIELPKE